MRQGRACTHCGSPARGNPCWYLIDNPKRREQYQRSGADLPCACDEYVESLDFDREWFWLRFWSFVFGVGLAMVFIWYMTRGWR